MSTHTHSRLSSSWRQLVLATGCLGLTAVAFCWGRYSAPSHATAAAPPAPASPDPVPAASSPTAPSGSGADYGNRIVATIYGKEPITREQFGEYLIARHVDELEPMVNKRIIELACAEQGITVTSNEIEAAFQDTARSFHVSAKEFVERVLKERRKTEYEYREDVLRPGILMKKLALNRVRVEDEDLRKAFESYYGEQVECQMIMWPRGEYKVAQRMYDPIRKSADEFDRAARMQASSSLASTGGKVKKFGKHCLGIKDIDDVIFSPSMHEGDVSPLLGTPDGYVVIKLLKRYPPDTTIQMAKVRPALEKEIIEKKLQYVTIPVVFKELKQKADPKIFLGNRVTEEGLKREVAKELAAQKDGLAPPASHQEPSPSR